jgi:N-acyl-D-aspartate/D-glutamate deacylase
VGAVIDLVVRNGTVVDGTGAAGLVADVAIDRGRVVSIGHFDDAAVRTVDASDLVVAPGFIDIHTHYDAQAFWDATLSPSPLHGVTTAISGNCGFSIAPLSGRHEDADYLLRMLARVEGMPVESLQQGVPWDWRSTDEFLTRLDRDGLSPNVGFLVGHSAIRRCVMQDEAGRREATGVELDAMKELLRDGLRAGGLGLSSTWAASHNDHDGNPVPSRHASAEELNALCSVVGEFPGTTLEFIPGVPPFSDELFALMASMSRAADRPINWNVLPVYLDNQDLVARQLAGADYAAGLGGRVVGLTLPDSLRNRLNFKTGFILDVLPGWDRVMALPDAVKLAVLSDPASRREMDLLAQGVHGMAKIIPQWHQYTIVETFSPETKPFEGMVVADIARRTGSTPWDALAEIVVKDQLRTVFVNQDGGQDRETWRLRVNAWRDPRLVVGASDSGAHLDMIDTFTYPTTMLAKAVRGYGLLSLEEAVHYLTGVPASLYGLRDRGFLRPGAYADMVIFDPETIGPRQVSTRTDLPGGAARLYGGAIGIEHVFVSGTAIVEGGEFTSARPGRVLRSGRDTDTVGVAAVQQT